MLAAYLHAPGCTFAFFYFHTRSLLSLSLGRAAQRRPSLIFLCLVSRLAPTLKVVLTSHLL